MNEEPTRKARTSIPEGLITAIRKLKFENPSDEKYALEAIALPKDAANEGTIKWLAALVARGGAKFDRHIEEHCQSHDWP